MWDSFLLISLGLNSLPGSCEKRTYVENLLIGSIPSLLHVFLSIPLNYLPYSSPGENHQIQPLSRKTSNLNHPGRGSSVTGSLTMAGDQQKVAVFYSLYYVMSKCGRFLKKDSQYLLCQARKVTLCF